ncbi:MAG: sugar transporter, permease component [Subtercola sp.]|nr:sugar transporter, permease component [Subtercola sp.]
MSTRSLPAPRAVTLRAKPSIGSLFEKWALVGALVVLLAICMATLPQFRTASLLTTMFNAQSLVLLLALTATIVLRTGDFDLSVPQNMVVSAAVIAQLSAAGVPPMVAVAIAVAGGIVVGIVNAALVVRVGVDSFVATLGSFTALAGLAYLVTGGKVLTGVPDIFVNLARSQLAGIPLITWFAWALVIVLWYVYQRTPVGRYMLFIGGNRNAARLTGVPVNRIRTSAYMISGGLAALVGALFLGYFGAVDPSVGGQYMLQPFAAAYLGATAITVGRFNAVGTLVALYFLTVGITALQLLGAQTWVTNVFYGLALMISVTAAKLAGRRNASARV